MPGNSVRSFSIYLIINGFVCGTVDSGRAGNGELWLAHIPIALVVNGRYFCSG